jgi:lipid-A-disaccharide synthase
MREVLFVVGEASGDLHAGMVADELRRLAPDRPLAGVGGSHMAAAGVTLLESIERLAVMGFVEVLRHVPRHWFLLRRLTARLASGRVAAVVLLDYPGFNLRVAEAAHRAGVPVVYYITPQVWAWGAKRLPLLARVVTRAACILPFEEPLLRRHGVPASFVGHPLLDRASALPTPTEARRQLGLDPERPVLAVLPGSRQGEVARHLVPFLEAARRVQARRPDVQVVVGVAPTVSIASADCAFPLVHGGPFVVQRAATAGILKSGTNTLEAAVAGLPHVIGYRTNALTFQMAKRLVTIPHIGLVNVVAGREVSREFVQDAFQPGVVADAVLPLLDESGGTDSPRAQALTGLASVRTRLGEAGAAGRVARMILDVVADGPVP